MAGRFSVDAVFRATDRVTKPVNKIQRRVSKLTRSMNRDFQKINRNIGKFSTGIKQAGVAVVASFALIGGAMANVINTGADFEQTLVNAAAKFPGEIRRGTAAFEKLEQAARKTGSTTEFTASQAAKALNFLAMAGFNAESSVAALPGVVNLATAAQVDLATATDIASDTLGAFGLATKDATQLGKNLARVNDVLAKTSTTANTTVEQMFEAIKDGGPIATTAGASIETVAALIGEMANSGIKGSRAGTTLKNMFVRLAAPVAEGAKLLRKFGIQTKDSNGDFLDIVDILGELNIALADLGTAERSGVLEGIFGKIPLAGVNILLKSGAKQLRAYRGELVAASGASTTMANVMRDTLRGRLNALTSSIEGVKISLFSMTNGPLAETIDKMTEWVRTNEKLIASNIGQFMADMINNFDQIVQVGRQVIGVITAYVALTVALKVVALATAALNIVTGTLSLTLGVAKGAMLAYSAVMLGIPKVLLGARIAVLALNLAFAANPLGVVLTAFGAFVALAAVVIASWNPVKEFFSDLWTSISDVVSGIGGALQRFGQFFGFGEDETNATDNSKGDNATQVEPTAPQIVSPQDRVARSIDEQRSTSTAEVTIRDESNRAEVTGGKLGNGVSLQQTGAF